MWYADVNLLAVLTSAVAAMVIGAVWYSPMLFGNAYMKLMQCDKLSPQEMEAMKKGMGPTYGLMFAGTLVMAYVLSIFLGVFQSVTVQTSTTIALWLWLGFMAPVCLGGALFGNLKGNDRWTLLGINAGNYFVSIMVMSVLLTLWK